jgi:hypothetical protein
MPFMKFMQRLGLKGGFKGVILRKPESGLFLLTLAGWNPAFAGVAAIFSFSASCRKPARFQIRILQFEICAASD